MIVHLNGHEMTTKKLTHSYLKEKLNLPNFYGNNLDALWDVLSTYSMDLTIIINEKKTLIENLGNYGEALIELFNDLKKENPHIKVEINS